MSAIGKVALDYCNERIETIIGALQLVSEAIEALVGSATLFFDNATYP